MPVPTLGELGWTPGLADSLEDELVPARVAVQHRGAYVVYAEDGERRARLAGRLAHGAVPAQLPTVGDWVGLVLHEDGGATIRQVLPRRSQFNRLDAAGTAQHTLRQVLAANVDVVFVVASLGGELNLRRVERFLTVAWESGAAPAVVLTKADLCADAAGAALEVERVAVGVAVHVVSCVTGAGVEELRAELAPGQTVVLLGSSGVGKSTLINRLVGEELLVTREVNVENDEGRHTTTYRQLVPLPGGALVIDTPGLRELQLWDGDEGIGNAFADVEELAALCRFNDCAHTREPGCAVLAAVDDGTLPLDRLRNYRKLQRELRAIAIRRNKRARIEVRKQIKRMERARRRDAW